MPHQSAPTPAKPEEYESAFRLLLAHCSPESLPTRVARALRMLQTGEMTPEGLLVFREHGRVVAATAGTVIPGGTGVVWPPRAVETADQTEREDCLARHQAIWLQQRGARLAQALLPPEEAFLGESLLRNGYRRITALGYLGHDHEMRTLLLEEPGRLRFEAYDRVDHAEFNNTMMRTFVGTLDCPEVTGARAVEDVVQGFQAQGGFEPSCWWLAYRGGQAVGVLLVSMVPEEEAWEVCYVGVIPEARRRGFGRELMLKALLEARAAGVSEVFLTVDIRNRPAWDLYRALGFEPFDSREVFLRLF